MKKARAAATQCWLWQQQPILYTTSEPTRYEQNIETTTITYWMRISIGTDSTCNYGGVESSPEKLSRKIEDASTVGSRNFEAHYVGPIDQG
ncbi:hypothetical protein M0802_003019 [Mischocyttarus mexicanus]|nr:hypothetical protein M0802_003019 [Mischocyttarus mexicanus]